MIVLDVLVVTSLQRLLGNEILGRAFGAIDGLIVGAILAGMLIAPISVRLTSVEGGLVIAGPHHVRAAASSSQSPRDRPCGVGARRWLWHHIVEVLELLGIFEGASRATLEGLAEAAVPVAAAAGAVVLRQGDPPDDSTRRPWVAGRQRAGRGGSAGRGFAV